MKNETDKIQVFRKILHHIPENNYRLLKMMFKHFTNLVAHSDQNKMTASNVGLSLASVFIRPINISDLQHGAPITIFLIDHYEEIFEDDDGGR
jgi:hypothetical protein